MIPATLHDDIIVGGSRPPGRVTMTGADEMARMTRRTAVDHGTALHVLATARGPAVAAAALHSIGSPSSPSDLAAIAAKADGTGCVAADVPRQNPPGFRIHLRVGWFTISHRPPVDEPVAGGCPGAPGTALAQRRANQ